MNCSYSLVYGFIPEGYIYPFVPILMWIIAVIWGTIVPEGALGILSMGRSLGELTSGRKSRLDVLDVFRVVAMCWVVVNHTGSEGRIDILERQPSAEAFKRNVHEHPIFGALLGNSALGVEIFLVLSGLLGARSWLRLSDAPFWAHYRSFIGRRICRLVPSIAFFVYIAAGPVMKCLLPRYYISMISTCGFSGLLSQVTFIGNFRKTPTCLGYLWYLGLDMQLYLVAPFLLHYLHKQPRQGAMAIISIVFASTLVSARYCLSYNVCNNSDVDIPFISYEGTDPATLTSIYAGLWEMYGRPQTKCGPFLLGLLLGYFTVHYDKFEISRYKSRPLFFVSLALAVATIYGILPEYWYPDQGNTLYNTLYTAWFRTVFAVCIIGMVVALVYRKGGCTVSHYWSVLGRLTFNVYLLHMPVIYIFNNLEYLQQAEGAIELMVVVPFVTALSFAAALVFYVFVESPLGALSSIYRTKYLHI